MNRTPDIPDRNAGSRAVRGIAPALAAALLLCCGCASSRAPATPPEFTLSEREARQAGALALYSKGILLESAENGDTNANKQAAREAFRQAVVLDPANRRPVEALVSNLTDDARYGEAFSVLEDFLRFHPDDAELRVEAARMAEASGHPADAARHCAALLAQNPEERELALALIRLYFQSDQVDEALRAMRDQQARFPDEKSAALPVSWAIHFTREGKAPERSLACLELALPQHTNDAERAALMTLAAENRLQLGETNTAETVLLQAYRTNPSANTAVLRLGAVWAARPDATNRLARQAQRESDPHTTRLILAATCQALGDHAAAAAALNDAYARRMRAGYFPSENFYLWHASLLETTKQHREAERILGDALAAHPSSHEAKNFLAYMWAEQGVRLDEADRLVTDALAAAPENAAYLDTKGWVLFKKDRLYDALQFLLKAAELDKEEAEILGHVAVVLERLGRATEASLFRDRVKELEKD
jgi:Tfp pilus assembly protein PilF